MIKKLAAIAGLTALAGCGVADVDAVRTVEPAGTDFSQALTREYQELAVFEADEMYDWPSAVLYAQKGLAAARSEIVLPFELKDWGLPANKVDEMTEARATMMALLNQSARTKVPAAAADAQGKFDCWVEQQTENHQPNDIAACRTAFYAALDIIKAEMAPPAPAAAPAPQAEPAPTTFTVYFPLNSTEFTVATQNVLIKAIQAARQTGSAVLIVGHTDTTGSAGYNMALSVKRADAVKAAFERSGVSDVRIRASGVGETDLAEPTADNVENGFNRRVTITFE